MYKYRPNSLSIRLKIEQDFKHSNGSILSAIVSEAGN